jgi:hypothetical protein
MEMVIAMAIGVLVLGTAVNLFSRALNVSYIVTQRAEMQQNGRAAIDLMAKDISLAGAGIPSGGVQLPTGNGATSSRFGCDQTQCYINNYLYPNGNYFYGAIPNPGAGQSVRTTSGALGPATDVVSVAYTDSTYPLQYYTVTFALNGGQATFTGPATPPNPLPNPWPLPAINDPAVGLKVGDLILFTNNVGSAIGEVTRVDPGGVVWFANGDPLNINSTTAANGNIKAILTGTKTIAYRLLMITYYIDTPPGLDGIRYTADDGPPRLMRQVNGQTPVPVAENVSGLQATYDIFDDVSGTATANLRDAGMSAGKSPNQIRKVNLNVSSRTPLQGMSGGGFQTLDLATSVSARDMSFRDRYN